TLRTFFDWCLQREIITSDPMAGLKRKNIAGGDDVRDRVLTDAELGKLMAFIRGSNRFDPHLTAVHLLVLTGARGDMINSLEWDEIGEDVISFPADRMKNGIAFELPITSQIRAVLDSIPRIHDCPFVFGRKLGSWDKAKHRIDGATGIADWQLRDIRRTVATGLQRFGISEDVIDAVQAHVKTGGKRVYQRHLYQAEKRDALEKWGAFLTACDG